MIFKRWGLAPAWALQLGLLVGLQPVWATEMVIGERVRVLYPEAAYAAYAQQLAYQAEAALAQLEAYFGGLDAPVYITLETTTDAFNAFAIPLPHPRVVLRPLFPTDGALGFGAEDIGELLLAHELTHLLQLGYRETPEGMRRLFGLVGDGLGAPAPPWLVEGLAVYFESRLTGGGRLDDPLTRAVLDTLALSEHWPSLAELSVGSYDRWPGGLARYLLGGSFVAYLIERYGFEALLATLRQMNAGLLTPFSQAWQQVTGAPLAESYAAWSAAVRRAAAARTVQDYPLLAAGSAPVLSPSGAQLAYVNPAGELVVAALAEAGLGEARVVLREAQLASFDWLDEGALVYSRLAPWGATSYRELFRYELASGQEIPLGVRHAGLVRALPDGCLLVGIDRLLEPSRLLQWCDGELRERLLLPLGAQLIGVDVSASGRLALIIWQRGESLLGLVDDALQLYRTPFAELRAVRWQQEALIVSAVADGVLELWRLDPSDWRAARLSASLGGAAQPTVRGDRLIAQTVTASGYALIELAAVAEAKEVLVLEPAALAVMTASPPPLPTAPYDPRATLSPYGWLPAVSYAPGRGLNVAVTLYGQDVSERHSYALTAGLAGSMYGYLEYGYQAPLGPLRFHQFPFGVRLRLGLWPHAPHLAASGALVGGVELSALARYRLGRWLAAGELGVGAVWLPSLGLRPEGRLALRLSAQRADRWGYPLRGLAVGLSAVHSATAAGGSSGLWWDARYAAPLAAGTLGAALRAGYRPAPEIPLALPGWSALASLEYRLSLPLAWRYGDGIIAAERLTLAPAVRAWPGGVGVDVALALDGMIGYELPLRLGVRAGYAGGLWLQWLPVLAGF